MQQVRRMVVQERLILFVLVVEATLLLVLMPVLLQEPVYWTLSSSLN
jgi:hypothetical protein